MKYVLLLTVAVFVAIAFSLPAFAEDSADLAAYIESIRASGMSEMAASNVRMVAGVLTNATILSYKKDPASGQYWTSYTSATCPKPDADDLELTRWKQSKVSESGMLLPKLKPIADADGSGFVTTPEAGMFRDTVEFGYLAAQAVRDDGPTIEAIARAAGRDIPAAEAKLREYATIAKRITDAGVTGLPVVDIPELKAAGN